MERDFVPNEKWDGGGYVDLVPPKKSGMVRHRVSLGRLLQQAGVPAPLRDLVAAAVNKRQRRKQV